MFFISVTTLKGNNKNDALLSTLIVKMLLSILIMFGVIRVKETAVTLLSARLTTEGRSIAKAPAGIVRVKANASVRD